MIKYSSRKIKYKGRDCHIDSYKVLNQTDLAQFNYNLTITVPVIDFQISKVQTQTGQS